MPELKREFAPHEEGAPLLTVLAGLPPTHYELALGATLIGRSGEVDWQLKHPEVSRRHCRFARDENGLCTVEDLGSRWGTKINGAALSPEVRAPLHVGDKIQIGPVHLYFGYGPPPADLAEAEREAGSDPDGAAPIRGPQVLMNNREVRSIPLGERVRFGRQGDVEVVLADPGISRQHAEVQRTATGFQVTDLRSRAGSFINGRRFETHALVIGDQLQMGPFFFRFDGRAFERTTGLAGVEIDVQAVRKAVGPVKILEDVTLRIDRGTFVGILGPSGAGKSSLLNALTGLRPADAGTIRFDGVNLYQEYDRLRSLLGYVPQDDIVHRELTVFDALFYSARLRLPAGTPVVELRKLVTQTIERLGLTERTQQRVGNLSGGQRKRVSVGVELLGRPAVLFLDEPTSGLDPAAEFKMMGLLRNLADGGCTVVCTTHVMENVYLTDRLFIVSGGRLVFGGDAAQVREYFDVPKLAALYDRLAERTAEEWQGDYRKKLQGEAEEIAEAPKPAAVPPSPPVVRPPLINPLLDTLPTLLRRQGKILCADWRNFAILFGQPLLIGAMVAWVTNEIALTLFFGYLATLWFGCSNAAQEIVRELPIYRRERTVGLGAHSYLLSKFLLLGTMTAAQGLFLYGWLAVLHNWTYTNTEHPHIELARLGDGSWVWQSAGVACTAFASAGIGLAISALARDAMQAMMIVPLVLIPQILFSGLTVKPGAMDPAPYAFTRFMPSYAAQTMMDVGVFWQRPIDGDFQADRRSAYDHLVFLETRLARSVTPAGEPIRNDPAAEKQRVADLDGEIRLKGRQPLLIGKTFNGYLFGMWAGLKLIAWTMFAYGAAWFGLKMRERG